MTRSGPHAALWRAACGEEVEANRRAGTWEVVERPPGKRVLPAMCQWVLTNKLDQDGEVARRKARFRVVVDGHLQRPGIELQVAGTVEEGLAAARERRPELVLLDMNLPDAPGGDMLDAMQSDAELRNVPVIVVSADATRTQGAE